MDHIKKILAASTSLGIVALAGFMALEPEIVIAQESTSINVNLTVSAGISISQPGTVTMAPNIGLLSDTSIGGATWNVITNDPDGYRLEVEASSTPAMQRTGGGSFADFQTTPAVWNITNSYQFGFSAYGTHVASATWGNGSSCGTGGNIPTDLNYRGFDGTTKIEIATNNAPTTMAGVDSTVCFAAAQDGVAAPSGSYQAIITATATTL
jgi:hypothetical protein